MCVFHLQEMKFWHSSCSANCSDYICRNHAKCVSDLHLTRFHAHVYKSNQTKMPLGRWAIGSQIQHDARITSCISGSASKAVWPGCCIVGWCFFLASQTWQAKEQKAQKPKHTNHKHKKLQSPKWTKVRKATKAKEPRKQRNLSKSFQQHREQSKNSNPSLPKAGLWSLEGQQHSRCSQARSHALPGPLEWHHDLLLLWIRHAPHSRMAPDHSVWLWLFAKQDQGIKWLLWCHRKVSSVENSEARLGTMESFHPLDAVSCVWGSFQLDSSQKL